ncbi:MAG: hypothetical protein ABIK77_06435 [candidate division WOR-3 bacterium]
MKKIFILVLIFLPVLATRIWDDWEMNYHLNTFQPKYYPPPPTIRIKRKFNYLQRIKKTCDFIASLQVSDSTSENFGGIIEAEHLPNIIETDNTQEAIWCFSRYYELTNRNDYWINIRRAWRYVLNFPAYREGGPGSEWYSVWNCGLALFCEMKYREVYLDSNYQFYIDTCLLYIYSHPLPFTNNLNVFVTSFVSGMLYEYGKKRNNQQAIDTALTYALRVKNWIEENPQRLQQAYWAMSGGTALWGVANSFCREDTIEGKRWLLTYTDSLPFFIPYGQWNNSWNIWIANAYKASYEITKEERFISYHQYILDTLLLEDRDDDGGIPATFGEPFNYDQSWISSYTFFMGMDFYVSPTFNYDIGVLTFLRPKEEKLYFVGDTINLEIIATNYGRENLYNSPVLLRGEINRDTIIDLEFLDLDTINFGNFILEREGNYTFFSYTNHPLDERRTNDTSMINIRVFPYRYLSGVLFDSLNNLPVGGRIFAYLINETIPFSSTYVDSSNGNFSLRVFDTLFKIRIIPNLPYPKKDFLIRIFSDTFINFYLLPAEILLVNDDPRNNYENFYTPIFDSLSISYAVWQRNVNGVLPISKTLLLRKKLIIWYTGDAYENTLDSFDQDSLIYFLNNNGNLLLSGQNIAKDLSNTQFLREVLNIEFVRDTVYGYTIFGNQSDTFGRNFTITSTVGSGGANNQRSRDEIRAINISQPFLIYDTLTNQTAGIYFQRDSSKVIFLAFGIEAVNRPVQRPEYMSRLEFIRKLLSYFGVVEIKEKEISLIRNKKRISNKKIIYDIIGRKRDSFKLNKGIYFIKENKSFKILIIK